MLCDFWVYQSRFSIIFLLRPEPLLIKFNERIRYLQLTLILFLFVHIIQKEGHLVIRLAFLLILWLCLTFDEFLPVELFQISVYLEIHGHKRGELPFRRIEICQFLGILYFVKFMGRRKNHRINWLFIGQESTRLTKFMWLWLSRLTMIFKGPRWDVFHYWTPKRPYINLSKRAETLLVPWESIQRWLRMFMSEPF